MIFELLGTELQKSTFSHLRGRLGKGQDAANFSHISKNAHEILRNSASFDINVVVVGDGANMVLNEKPTINCKLRGLKLRGLSQNQPILFTIIKDN